MEGGDMACAEVKFVLNRFQFGFTFEAIENTFHKVGLGLGTPAAYQLCPLYR